MIATGDNFPDALSASALAGVYRCPIILTSGSALSPEARALLQSRPVTTAYIVGGQSSVSPSVEQAISSMGIQVTRVAGADRVGTSLAVRSLIKDVAQTPIPYLFIATGANFADALSAAPLAYAYGASIILTQGGRLTDEAVAQIKADGDIKSIIIVGGTNAVSDQVSAQLGDGYVYTRIEGSNRYETSVAMANFETRQHSFSWSRPCIATGQNFPDALAGSALSGHLGSPLLLVSPSSDAAASAIAAHAGEISLLRVLGGESTVSDALARKTAGGVASGNASTEASYVLRYHLGGLKKEGGSGDIGGGIYVPGTLAEYRSYYGANGNVQKIGNAYVTHTATIPGTNLSIEYMFADTDDGAAEAWGIRGTLGDLVDGLPDGQRLTVQDFARSLRAYEESFDGGDLIYGNVRATLEKCGSNYVDCSPNAGLAYVYYADGTASEVRALAIDLDEGNTVSRNSTARLSTYASIYQ